MHLSSYLESNPLDSKFVVLSYLLLTLDPVFLYYDLVKVEMTMCRGWWCLEMVTASVKTQIWYHNASLAHNTICHYQHLSANQFSPAGHVSWVSQSESSTESWWILRFDLIIRLCIQHICRTSFVIIGSDGAVSHSPLQDRYQNIIPLWHF